MTKFEKKMLADALDELYRRVRDSEKLDSETRRELQKAALKLDYYLDYYLDADEI